MKIGGLQKVSLIEYPGKISAVIFTQGCNFRCPYCHNPELVDPDLYGDCLGEEEIFSFLEKRRGKLEAVTVTGGEPTIQPDLAVFLRRLKGMEYLVKIDSNGSHPDILEELLREKLVDYIAMDVKAPLGKYEKIMGTTVDCNKIKRSIDMILASEIDHEFRTTVPRSLLEEKDLLAIGRLVKNARQYTIQKFVPSKTLNPSFLKETTYSDEEFSVLKKKLEKNIQAVVVK
ncbi:MAG: anaerobic ribonucleoside-triphosphate reductase activating protein [Deltaproteobacteria bacterium]|nr:anaerobic ribonucleoside-triphosphate reductase activating protein [Deltaproteobacteria bacterium]